jgi:hypothetical protein
MGHWYEVGRLHGAYQSGQVANQGMMRENLVLLLNADETNARFLSGCYTMIQNGQERKIQAVHKYRLKSLDAPEVESISTAWPVTEANYQNSVWYVPNFNARCNLYAVMSEIVAGGAVQCHLFDFGLL